MTKMNLKNVKELKQLPKGVFNFQVTEVKLTYSDDGAEMVRVKSVVVDDSEFNGTPNYRNFIPSEEKSLPFMVQFFESLGLSRDEINEIDDTKKIEMMIKGRKFTATNKPDKEFGWGKLTNLKPYEG